VERIVFHIGTHKTGSSAIQGSLLQSSDALLARGILYPRTGRGRPGLARLTDELRESSTPAEAPVHRALVDETLTSDASVLVLSAEDFSSPRSAPRSAAWARSLCTELRADRSNVVAYVRPQWEWIESSYAQQVKTGLIWAPFADYLEAMLASDSLDYRTRLDPWREAFEDLEVRPYSSALLFDGDVVDDFWKTVDFGRPIQRAELFANHRLGARTTEMLRTIRSVLAERGLDDRLPVRRALARASRRIEADLPRDDPFSPLTSELVARAAERFAASNAEVVRRHFGGLHAELFAPPTDLERDPSRWSLEHASTREREVFAGALAQVLDEARTGKEATGRRKAVPSTQVGVRRPVRRGRRARRAVKRVRRLVAIRTRLGLRG
jgi:hypothetical protein